MFIFFSSGGLHTYVCVTLCKVWFDFQVSHKKNVEKKKKSATHRRLMQLL